MVWLGRMNPDQSAVRASSMLLARCTELDNTSSSSRSNDFGYQRIRYFWQERGPVLFGGRGKAKVEKEIPDTFYWCSDGPLFFGLWWGLEMEWGTKISQNWLSFSLSGVERGVRHSYPAGRDQTFHPGILIPDGILGPIIGQEPQRSLLLSLACLFIWSLNGWGLQ